MRCRGCQDDSRKRLSRSSKRWSRSTAKAYNVFLLAVLPASQPNTTTDSHKLPFRQRTVTVKATARSPFPATAAPCAISASCFEKTKPPALVFPKPEPKSKPGRNAAAVKVERRTRRARLARRSRSSNTLTALGGGSGQLLHRRLPLHFSSIHLSRRSSARTIAMMNQ